MRIQSNIGVKQDAVVQDAVLLDSDLLNMIKKDKKIDVLNIMKTLL